MRALNGPSFDPVVPVVGKCVADGGLRIGRARMDRSARSGQGITRSGALRKRLSGPLGSGGTSWRSHRQVARASAPASLKPLLRQVVWETHTYPFRIRALSEVE